MATTTSFLSGVFPFAGLGLQTPSQVGKLRYTVPLDRRAEMIYVRGGNSTDELIIVSVSDGRTSQLFPIGAKSAMHVTLAVIEDLMPDTAMELFVAAPLGVEGFLVLDVGFVQIRLDNEFDKPMLPDLLTLPG